MDSTKSFSLSACVIALLCVVSFPASSAAVVPDGVVGGDSCGTGCALDITIVYQNNKQLSPEDLPNGFQALLQNYPELDNVVLEEAARFKGLLRDSHFFASKSHSHSDEAEAEAASEISDEQTYTAYLKLSYPGKCSFLPTFDLFDPFAVAAALRVSLVQHVIALPSECATDDAAAAPLALSGTAAVVVSDFADGSYDNFATITTDSGEEFVVSGPDSSDAMDHAQWSSLRSGDHVEMQVQSSLVGPSDNAMGMGMAYDHAQPRHRLIAITKHSPGPKDKTTPTGVTSILAIRIKYTNFDPDNMCTEACVTSNIWTGTKNVDAMYRDNSNGALTIPQASGKVVTVTLSVATTSYSSCNDLASIANAADAAVASQFPSITLSSYTNKVYFTGAICGIGIAYVGGAPGQAFINAGYADAIAHEIGHNFGMNHANRDPGDDNVVDEYYGDRSCIMGYSGLSLRGFNLPHRIDNGWIPSSSIMDLSTACTGSAQVIQLSPLEQANTAGAIVGVRAVRRNLGRYFISFRNSAGYDSLLSSTGATYINQVTVHYQLAVGAYTQLVAVIGVGQSWSQANGDLTVTVDAISSSGATIEVTYCRPSAFSGVTAALTCGSSMSSTNVGATNLVGYTSGDVLYTVAMTAGVQYTISTCGSTLDTVLRLYSDGLYAPLTSCDNCGGCSSNVYNAVISKYTPTTSGNFVVSVEGYNTASGTFSVSLTCSGTAASPSPAASPAASPSSSPAVSPAASPSAVASKSPAPSATPASHTAASPAASPSRPATPSRSPSRPATPSRSPSRTPSHSVSSSRTPSHSVSASRSRSASRSASPSRSRSAVAPVCGAYASGAACTLNTQCASCACSQSKCR